MKVNAKREQSVSGRKYKKALVGGDKRINKNKNQKQEFNNMYRNN